MRQLKDAFGRARIQNRSRVFSSELRKSLELGFLLDAARRSSPAPSPAQ